MEQQQQLPHFTAAAAAALNYQQPVIDGAMYHPYPWGLPGMMDANAAMRLYFIAGGGAVQGGGVQKVLLFFVCVVGCSSVRLFVVLLLLL